VEGRLQRVKAFARARGHSQKQKQLSKARKQIGGRVNG